MTRSELSAVFSMPPSEAIAWLRSKDLQISFDYREVWGEAHLRTFTVAKVMKLDLLKDLHDSLTRALEQGIPFKEWHENIRPTLAAKGWYGRREIVNPETGEVKTITIGARRLNTIYETNLRSAYNHGRWVHQRRSPTMEYWRYTSALLPTTRPSHRAMHGRIYPRDHPFWAANYPPNGYNCKCKVRAYSKKMLERRGWQISDDYEPIADPGFAHPPGNPLSSVWEGKILHLPHPIAEPAKIEKKLSDLYDGAFDHDPRIRDILLRHKPLFLYEADDRKRAPVSYRPKSKTIIYRGDADLSAIRHEAGHLLDHLTGWSSRRLLRYLRRDALRWDVAALNPILDKHRDPQLHDLFYLTSGGKAGIPTRDETDLHKEALIHLEAFANFFQYHISGNEEALEILRRFFPESLERFERLLDEIKQDKRL